MSAAVRATLLDGRGKSDADGTRTTVPLDEFLDPDAHGLGRRRAGRLDAEASARQFPGRRF